MWSKENDGSKGCILEVLDDYDENFQKIYLAKKEPNSRWRGFREFKTSEGSGWEYFTFLNRFHNICVEC